MDRYFVAGVWGLNTYSKQHMSGATRLDLLREALIATRNKTRQHLPSKARDRLQTIFLAPEYLFARPVNPNGGYTNGLHHPHLYADTSDKRFVNAQTKEQIVNDLRGLSMAFDQMLIVPGTIAWKKPLVRTGPERFKSDGEGNRTTTLKLQGREEKARLHLVEGNRIRARARGITPGQALGAKLSGDMKQGDTVTHAATTTRDKLLGLGGARNVAHNTAYVMYDGRVVFKYHKQGDYHEVLSSNGSTVYIPGTQNGAFEVDGVRFGMEICLDHAIGFLGRHPGGKDPHVHMIASASVPVKAQNVRVKEGGYVLHADSLATQTEVFRRSHPLLGKGRVDLANAVQPVDTLTVGGDPLKFYLLHIKT